MTEKNFKILEKLALQELAVFQDNWHRAKREQSRFTTDEALAESVRFYGLKVDALQDALSELRAMTHY